MVEKPECCNDCHTSDDPYKCKLFGTDFCDTLNKYKRDGVCDNTIECEYNYHDPVHPDVCHFECMLDANLEFNDRLTPKAQEYRDKLIIGVERMMKKVEDYKNSQ